MEEVSSRDLKQIAMEAWIVHAKNHTLEYLEATREKGGTLGKLAQDEIMRRNRRNN